MTVNAIVSAIIVNQGCVLEGETNMAFMSVLGDVQQMIKTNKKIEPRASLFVLR
jgi:hypothetical protein